MRFRGLIVAVAALALLVAACGNDDDDSAGTTTTTASETADGGATSDVLDVKVEDNDEFGEILVTQDGFTLYVFTPDGTSGESICTGECASQWPPLISNDGEPPAPLDAADFSTTVSEGSTQVVFMGRPLYRYSGDPNPGDTNGQGVNGNWFVVSPSGPVEDGSP